MSGVKMDSSVSTVKPLFLGVLSMLLVAMISCLFTTINAAKAYPPVQESDRVINLPGQPSNPSISHFSGYITVHPGRALFYWFFEAQSQPSKRPLLLWLNGEANLLFVESPVGVGFSYTNTSSDLINLNDGFVAEDAYNFLANWLKRFPQFKAHDFFISGESYAGHYVPQLAELVYDRNKDKNNYPFINLKGFIVGNPETDDFYDSKGLLEYAWSHAVISDQDYEKAKQVCDFKLLNWTDECIKAMNVVFQKYREIDIYNIYAPTCLLNTSSTSADDNFGGGGSIDRSNLKVRRMRILGGYDPCFASYTEEYFNRIDVQSSLHVNVKGNTDGKWKVCNNSILRTYDFTVFSILPIYSKLVKAGLKIWVYSGDTDGRVPVLGTRYWIEALGLSLTAPWRSWYHNNQVRILSLGLTQTGLSCTRTSFKPLIPDPLAPTIHLPEDRSIIPL